jgi:hypothetical protein
MPRFRLAVVLPLVLGLSAGAVVPAFAGGNYGRETFPHEVVTGTIGTPGDEDDFVFQGAAGFKVSVQVKKGKEGDLAPVVELVAPDGTVETDGVVAKAAKTSAKLTATLAEGGLFAIRVKGASGSGAFTLKWKLTPAKVGAVKKVPMGGNATMDVPFPARGGALLTWTLSFQGDGAAQVAEILDPEGNAVPFDPETSPYVTRKITSEKAVNLPLPGGLPGGEYRLRITNALFPSTVNCALKVALPKVASTAVTLNPAEPSLTSIDRTTGSCGAAANLTGTGLSETPLAIRFGGGAATNVLVTGGDSGTPHDGTAAYCRAPGGSGTVDVVYVNADGQVAVLRDAFAYLPEPVLQTFDPTTGPGAGGTDLTITGTGFQAELQGLYSVLVGGTPASLVTVLDENTITCRTPAHVAGPKPVVLRDSCGQEFAAPGTFTYGSGMLITTIRPAAVPAFGGVPVLVSGSNFTVNDVVSLDDVPVPTTPVIYQTFVLGHRIEAADLPAHAPGKVDVKVSTPSGPSATKVDGLQYFGFTDVTGTAIPAASATDDWGGVANAVIDKEGDGKVDWILVAHTDAFNGRPGTRALKNDGTGTFTDVTGTDCPTPATGSGFGANALLVGRLNADAIPDVYLSTPGTGVAWDANGDGNPDWWEARMLDEKRIDPWARMWFPSAAGIFVDQQVAGNGGLFGINGLYLCSAAWACAGVDRPGVCKVFDYDFRSVGAAMGDLDGDGDSDIVLVNDRSLARFRGLSVGTWVGCYTGQVNYQYYEADAYGHATRVLLSGSNGGLTDRTKEMFVTDPAADEDSRGVAAAIADVIADSSTGVMNDILVVHDQPVYKDSGAVPAVRLFRQKNSAGNVVFEQQNGFFPAVQDGVTDPWIGNAVASADLNVDFYRDVVLSLDAAPPAGASFSTRILLQDGAQTRVVDRTNAILTGVLPAGDDGRARVLVARDFDRDGDVDLFLSTASSTGSGNRRTRLLINADRDPVTGYPVFVDASSLFPAVGSDTGAAVALSLGDVDGDGHLDIVITDTHETSGTPVKRTRIWKQVRQ